MGHLQVVIRLDQLCHNAWSILGSGGGDVLGVPWSGFISGVVVSSMSSPLNAVSVNSFSAGTIHMY